MREHGVVASAGGLLPFGHLGWAYWNRAEFRARAAEYLADGLAEGQWVEYVGAGPADTLRAELAGLDGGAEALDRGRAAVVTLGDFYVYAGDSDVVDPVASVARRVAAVEDAIARGFAGLRAVIDATGVNRTPEQREAFARFEYLIDQQMSRLPVSAACCYDVSLLDTGAAAELTCLHPYVNFGASPFRLYADDGVAFALAGELDIAAADLFGATLARTMPLTAEQDLVVDGRALEFVDHSRLLVLDRQAYELGRKVLLRTSSPTLARVAGLLPLEALRVEVVPG